MVAFSTSITVGIVRPPQRRTYSSAPHQQGRTPQPIMRASGPPPYLMVLAVIVVVTVVIVVAVIAVVFVVLADDVAARSATAFSPPVVIARLLLYGNDKGSIFTEVPPPDIEQAGA